MQTRSSVTCRLNRSFRAALERNRFVTADGMILDPKNGHELYVRTGETICCGIDELDFQPLNEEYDEWVSKLSDSNFKELVARYVKASCEVNDERVVFVGIPTSVGQSSMYNIAFYERLLDTLKTFGFRELCKPYRNRNSGNTITVLAGQMPE